MLIKTIERFFTDKYSYQASTLAFATILAAVPLFSVALFISTHFPIFAQGINLIKDYIFANLIPTSSQLIQQYLDMFAKQALRLPISSIIFSFLTVFFLIRLVKDVINNVWHFPHYRSHRHVLLHWIVILLALISVIIGVYVTHYILQSASAHQFILAFGLSPLLKYMLPVIINTIALTLLYWAVPNVRLNFMSSLLGGLIAAGLFEAAKYGFILYVRIVPSYELIYGALSVIPVFLFWIYISWIIIIYGAIVTHNLEKHKIHVVPPVAK